MPRGALQYRPALDVYTDGAWEGENDEAIAGDMRAGWGVAMLLAADTPQELGGGRVHGLQQKPLHS